MVAWRAGPLAAQAFSSGVQAGSHPLLLGHPPPSGAALLVHRLCRHPVRELNGSLICPYCQYSARGGKKKNNKILKGEGKEDVKGAGVGGEEKQTSEKNSHEIGKKGK